MTNLEIFAEIMKDNFYFSDKVMGKSKNHLKWSDDRTLITIYNENALKVHGVGDIGQAAEVLNLCCTACWNVCDHRVELHVH